MLKKLLATFYLLSVIISPENVQGLPDLRDNNRELVSVLAGQEAILSCVVKNLDNNTVIWRRMKSGRPEILTAGGLRVTSDTRISVIHNEEDKEWLLSISSTRTSDSGQYICEVNSSPIVRITQLLKVTSPHLPMPSPFALAHNFTECCIIKNVPNLCLGFCNLQNIVLGSTGISSHDCEDHLASIAFCMADGKNHEPCCIKENIPEACREVCRGEYTLQSASVLHHYACSHYSSATLACIAQGVELLPGPPEDLVVEPMSDKEIRVKWKTPSKNFQSLSHFILNVTELKGFDELESSDLDGPMGEEEEYFPDDGKMPPEKPKIEREGRKKNFVEKFTEIKINGTETSTILKDLKPYTMYEIYVISVNQHGSSLPTYKLRALTLMPAGDEPVVTSNVTLPDLPNIRSCCERKELPMENCVDRFCDPRRIDEINLTDMMICAPWVTTSLPCLTQGRDHTPCCIQRGLPTLCLNLCHGNVSRIDYQYFQCLPYMSIFSNCLMEGYGVLASAPRDLTLHHKSTHWAVLHWQRPEKLSQTVLSYNVHYRPISGDEGDGLYTTIPNIQSPYLLNGLHPGVGYEVYVRAANEYGVSQASPRLLFQTELEQNVDSTVSTSSGGYNMTECCDQSGVSKMCLPLCNFHARLSEVKDLVPTCLDDMHKMLRCGAGGRNHIPCCEARQVHTPCLELCAGIITQVSTAVASSCIADLISIVECMEEGTDVLPGPVTDLEVFQVNQTTVHLEWKPPTDSNATHYEVYYEGWETEDVGRKSFIVNETNAYISDLDSKNTYVFYVLSHNDFGTSTASSIVRLNLTFDHEGVGTPSHPEAVALRSRNVTSLTIIWLPPSYTHPLDHLRYKLYYRTRNQTIPNSLTTTSLGATLNDLPPNTEFEIYVSALTDKGEGPPAEVLTVWTDAVYPAYVEVPNIFPPTDIQEGGNLTVLCLASGTPMPTISIFLNGVLFIQAQARRLSITISNVTREMDIAVCHAENGYGMGMQASKSFQVSFAPSIYTSGKATTVVGQTVTLSCLVTAHPEPHMVWWKDVDGKVEIINGDHLLLRTDQEEEQSYSMQLTVMNATEEDAGNYYCHAENSYGSDTKMTLLQTQPIVTLEPSNMRDCCIEQKVVPECMDACTMDLDVENVVSRSRCIPELHKLMYCAADGSDHRRCCLGWGVPRRCIGWCQGKAIHHSAMCVLVWSKQIVSCFQEGKDLLPGPPQAIQVLQLSSTAVRVIWELPYKNPQTVDHYRVSWRKTFPGRLSPKFHNETEEHSLIVDDMEEGASYEFTIKAVNRRGSSVPSSPVKIDLLDEAENFASVAEHNEGQVGLAIGLVIAVVIIILLAAVVYLYFRRRGIHSASGGVSFENPSYMKDGTSDTVQIHNVQESNGGLHANEGWKSETLHVAEAPSTGNYEELRNDNINFKQPKDIL